MIEKLITWNIQFPNEGKNRSQLEDEELLKITAGLLTNSSDSFTNLKFRIYKKNTNSCYFLTVKLSKKPVLDQCKKFGLFFNSSS